jgi:RimJ/RimL family protein N-acetyltransferase
LDLWPLADLTLRAGPLELRPPADSDLPALAVLFPTEAGWDPTLPVRGHDVAQQGRRSVLAHVWRSRAEAGPARWRLCLGAYLDGEPIGEQDLKGVDFPQRRIVETSSWLGAGFRGRGLGKAMRALVLHLAFEGLGALAAETESAEENKAALGVTSALGYRTSGDTYRLDRGEVVHMRWSRLTRDRWSAVRPGYGLPAVEMAGLAGCRDLLGLPDETATDAETAAGTARGTGSAGGAD